MGQQVILCFMTACRVAGNGNGQGAVGTVFSGSGFLTALCGSLGGSYRSAGDVSAGAPTPTVAVTGTFRKTGKGISDID